MQAEASPVMMAALQLLSDRDCGYRLFKVYSNFQLPPPLPIPIPSPFYALPIPLSPLLYDSAALSTHWKIISASC